MSLNIEKAMEAIRLTDRKKEIERDLPHLYGFKWYPWAKDFFESTNKTALLCAGNQVSKSSTQIRKCIHWATASELWPKLWKRRPLQFWYLYPTREVASIEFEKKWIPEFLPRGVMKTDPKYGWKAETKNKFIWAIHFNSGVSVYFKTYATDVQHLQSGSVDYALLDEELPTDLLPELQARLFATDGYFSMVFTATLAQEFWREVVEEIGTSRERMVGAWKRQVSMYDCLTYSDGSPSHWTVDRIQRIERSCKSPQEVARRVYGRFTKEEGLAFPGFDRQRNIKKTHPIPGSWKIYAGIDVGSGGDKGHPAAITFVAMNPEYTKGRVFKGWRGDHVQTTAGDVLNKYQEMKRGLTMTGAYYDFASKDLHTIATRMGVPVMPADKSRELGEQILNTAFKNDMLMIYDEPELIPLVEELTTLDVNARKTKAKDDFIDSLRYACSRIPWDFSIISTEPRESEKSEEDEPKTETQLRREMFRETGAILSDTENEIEEWNDLYEN